jgi:hypothetical protein
MPVDMSVLGTAPVAAWCPSLDTAGNGTTTLTDLVGGSNGTLTNMVPASDWTDDGSGLWSLDFDGSNDYVALSSGVALGTLHSVSEWVYCGVIPATTTIPALIPTAGAIADQVWDEATAGHTTSGTYGGRVVRSMNSNVEVQITGSNHIAADVHEFQTGVITAAALARMRSLRLHSLRMRLLRFNRDWHWRHRCSQHWIDSDSRWQHWLATVQIRRQRLRRIRLFSGCQYVYD